MVALGTVSLAQAQTVDPSGTWTFASGGRGGGAPGGAPGGGARRGGGGGTNTLVLKYDKATKALTGTLQAPATAARRGRGANAGGADTATNTPPPAPAAPPAPVDIKNGKLDAQDNISFDVSQAGRRGGDPVVTTYKGKVTADTITGTSTRPGFGGGDPIESEWIAKKTK